MPNRRHTVILLRGESRELLRWDVTVRRVAATLGGVVAIVGVAALAGWLWLSARSDRIELANLRQENQTLRSSNSSIEDRIQELQSRLVDSEDRTRKLAIVAGVESLGAGHQPGLGGELDAAPRPGAQLDGIENRTAELSTELDRVETKIDHNFKLLSATPSIWPAPGLLASGFGWRRDPITGQRAFHNGVDIDAPPGHPILAAASGVVAKVVQEYSGLGRGVFISHGFGVTTVYGHMSRILVRPGQRVQRGDTIGLVGNTGRATGYHLHYTVEIDGKPVNPLPYLLGSVRSGS